MSVTENEKEKLNPIIIDFLKMISKISKNDVKSLNDLKENNLIEFYFFFKVLEKEEILFFLNKIKTDVRILLKNEIFDLVSESKDNLKLNENDVTCLYSFFFLKSFISNNWFNDSNDFIFFEFDSLVSNFFEYQKKFWIFYFNKKINLEDYQKNLIKLYIVLNYKGFITEKKDEIIKSNKIKTIISFSINFFIPEEVIYEKILINFEEFKIVQINNSSYLIGTFFLKTIEIFKKNIFSNKKFKLNQKKYLEKINKRFVYIDKNDFFEIKNKYKEKIKIESDNVEKCILDLLNEIKEKKNEIKKISVNMKKNYLKSLKNVINEDFKEFNKQITNEDIFLFAYTKIIMSHLKEYFYDIGPHIENDVSSFLILFYKKYILNGNLDSITFKKIKFFLIYKLSEKITLFKEIDFEKKNEHNYNNWEFSLNNFLINKNEINKEKLDIKINECEKKLLNIYKLSNDMSEEKKLYSKQYFNILLINNEIKNLQKKFSVLFNYFIFEIIEKLNLFNKKIFFAYYFDFRGRQYYESLISITFFKASRYFMNYGNYTKDEIENFKKYKYKNWKKFDKDIIDIEKELNIKKNDYYIKESIFWIIISIGKEFLIKNKEFHTLDEIFFEGKKRIFEKNIKIEDLEKDIILMHYIKILKSFNSEYPLKRFIQKDATASFIQNTIRLIGPKDENALIKANLLSRTKWYDTYIIALDEWKKNNGYKYDIKLINKYFLRKTIKKPIMISSYDATFSKKWEYFLNEIENIYKEDYLEHIDELLEMFKDFMNFIDKKFWHNVFLAQDSKILIEIMKEKIKNTKSGLIKSYGGSSDLIYNKQKEKKIDMIINIPNSEIKIRKVKKIFEIDEKKIWNKKIHIATRANWVHFSDATLIRQINNSMETPFLTIHDCFLIDPFNIIFFINKANKSFKINSDFPLKKDKKLINKIYSMFIFI